MDLKASKRHDPIRRRRVVVPALMFLICWGASTASASALQAPIRLISPGNYEHLYSDSVAFQWMHRPVRPDSIHHYEIQFWAPRQFFRLRRRLSDLRSETGYFQYPVSALRGTFRRHGRYYWRVSVVDLEGRIRSSETRSFFIPAPELSEELNPWYFPCEIRWLSVRPVQTQAYRDFLEGIEPAAYLEAHSNLGLVFRQDRLLKQRLHLTEQVFFHSRIGLGGEISAQLRLVRNRFFTFFPESGFQLSKFSTGIGPYATLQYEACLGGGIEIMPRALIVVRGGWIPVYHVRYQTAGGEARRFSASGWELGVRFLVPESIIPPFSVLGLTVDPQRFPLIYRYRRVFDSYSDLWFETRTFGVGFLFR